MFKQENQNQRLKALIFMDLM